MILRKLSSALDKFMILLDKVMRFERRCDKNPEVMDLWNRDDEGVETLIECRNREVKREVKRY